MDKLSFEGEYKNGEKNGKGKEYDHFGRLEFEVEYLNNKSMDKEKNIIKIKKFYSKGNIKMEKNGMEKDMILMAI